MIKIKNGHAHQWPLLLFFSACFFLLPSQSRSLAKCPEIIQGFRLRDINGKAANLSCSSQKVLVINFWTTWCPPCRAEIPALIKLHKKYSSRGVVIAGIALQTGTPQEIRSFITSNQINYPVFIGEAKDPEAQDGIISVPVTLIIDRKNKIRHKLIGYHSEQEIEDVIKKTLLLAE